MKIIYNITLFLFLISSCTTKSYKQTVHPTHQNISGKHISNIVDIEHSSIYNKPEMGSLICTLENMQKKLSIGVRYGSDEQMFARIQDVVMDLNERIYILDFNNQHIRVFG